ncbi:lipase family protein [Streptomyces sp. NBC_01433]|uniref:lipase family protein n=1 Tax=Streptomyces sp. NBC_01433 TaxID=2903864 RepID=UPI00225548F3|nr:lipase family protein [Streptomyces sp. NBC_01433]MCX4679353.1 lipase family protein [Streptomyces sp. NBC_01433]
MPIPALDHRQSGYDLAHAYWLARAARAAYLDADAAREELSGWGFDRFRHFVSPHAMPFPLEDTQAYVAGSEHMVLVAFRGTEPLNIQDWLSDVNTPPVPGPGGKGFVHYGFHQALAAVYPRVRDTVTEFTDRGQSVWLAGHSLGGALAMLAGSRLHFEADILPAGIYTYGQPRTCDRTLAGAYNTALKNRTHRFVNNNDIVPQVPPAPLFSHVDQLRYFDALGALRDRMPLVPGIQDRIRGLTADLFAPTTDGIRDHLIDSYLTRLEENLT